MSDPASNPDDGAGPQRRGAFSKVAVVLSALFLLLVVLLGYRATLADVEVPHENVPPRVSHIVATLDPPYTHYRVFTGDLDEDTLAFEWILEGHGGCDDFTFNGPQATWSHDSEDCPHEADAHPGVIKVRVKGGGHAVERVYEGGSAPHEPDPLYPPDPAGGVANNTTEDDDTPPGEGRT